MSIITLRKLTPEYVDYTPTSVIMGKTGAGKTTLLNSICNSQNETGDGRGSITRHLFRKANHHGNYPFSLIDTPGTNSSEDTFKHAFLLREALTCCELNTIFIVIKYENRFDVLLERYLEEQMPVDKFNHKLVLIVTHCDHANDFKNVIETKS